MHEGNRFSAKTFGKSPFYCQNDWSGHCPAGQFWLLESALSFYNGYFRDSFWPKKLFDGRGLFGSKIKERISLTRKSAKNAPPPPPPKKKKFNISCISRIFYPVFQTMSGRTLSAPKISGSLAIFFLVDTELWPSRFISVYIERSIMP